MPLKARVTNMAGGIVAEKRDGTRHYHRHDAQGNTIALINDAGATTDTYSYWPNGEERTSTGSTVNPYRYGGKWGYYRDESGRAYVRERTLREDLARWMTVDPVWPYEAAYCYVTSNPTTWNDPDGGWTRKGGPCKSTIITPGKGDRIGVIVGDGGTMIGGGGAIRKFRKPGEDCIAVNGGFFGTKPYEEGKSAQPIEDVVDCSGKRYPGRIPDRSKVPPLPIHTPGGSIVGRPPGKPGGAAGGKVKRTGACTDAQGNLLFLIVIPGVGFSEFEKCMKDVCKPPNKIVLLDGGGSSQIVSDPNHRGGRPVHNWIVICS